MFEEGLFHGIGFLNIKEEDVRTMIEHNAFMNDPNRWFRYVGEWSHGRISGRGKLVTTSEIYSGGFARGQFDGEGKLIFKDGSVTEGRFYSGIHL